MTVAKLIPDNIKRVSRSLGHALWLGQTEDWHMLTVILTARLTYRDRVALGWSVLRCLKPADIEILAEAVLKEAGYVAVNPTGAGLPIAPLFNVMDQAALWAEMATPEELEAYCLACFQSMNAKRGSAFLEYVQGEAAA